MGCDRVHYAIEFGKRKTEIVVPQQWETVIPFLQSPTRSFFFAAEIACREVYFFANWYGSEGRPLLFDMLTFISLNSSSGHIQTVCLIICLLFKYRFGD
jgi:hypothetical protein